jgi:glycerophosphoryl diester phosphodiesterase
VSRPLIIAHRGASGVEVENSLAAFRAADRQGADAVELDIYSTADGALVVHHGERVGGLHIPHASLREIRGRPLANGEPIPTLEDALAVIVPRMIAFVELKSVATRDEERLFDAIERCGAPEKVALHGFDHRVVHRMGERRPHIRRGVILASHPADPIRCLEDADATILWQERQSVNESLVTTVHGAGMQLFVWTVNDPADVVRFAKAGVDGICTDYPDLARAAFASLPA